MASRTEDTLLYLFVMLGGIVAVQFLRNRQTGQGGAGFQNVAPAAPESLPGSAQGALDIIAPMHVSPNGQAFIKRNEQLRLQAYPDASGHSIGWGHYFPAGTAYPQTITVAQAQAYFDDDIANAEQTINSNVTVLLSQTQFDALADFVFNVGANAFEKSTLLRMLNNGNYRGASQQFLAWTKSGGGARRQAEANMFNSGAVSS